jgi:uroporphyrinogen decarboxylase
MIQIFDSWAGELSPATFNIFALPYLRHIASALPNRLSELKQAHVPMTVFAKGAWYALDELCDSGFNVVSLDWLQDPAEAMKIARGRVTLQGNADPGILYGTKEAISTAVEEMVMGFGGGKKGWIANLGHGEHSGREICCCGGLWKANYGVGITPLVQPEDLRFFLEEIHRIGGR